MAENGILHDNSDSKVNRLQAGQGNMCSIPRRGTDSLPNSTRNSPGVQPAFYPVPSGGAPSLGAQRLGLGLGYDHSHPASTTVKDIRSDTELMLSYCASCGKNTIIYTKLFIDST
jgi:hypothetical protein